MLTPNCLQPDSCFPPLAHSQNPAPHQTPPADVTIAGAPQLQATAGSQTQLVATGTFCSAFNCSNGWTVTCPNRTAVSKSGTAAYISAGTGSGQDINTWGITSPLNCTVSLLASTPSSGTGSATASLLVSRVAAVVCGPMAGSLLLSSWYTQACICCTAHKSFGTSGGQPYAALLPSVRAKVCGGASPKPAPACVQSSAKRARLALLLLLPAGPASAPHMRGPRRRYASLCHLDWRRGGLRHQEGEFPLSCGASEHARKKATTKPIHHSLARAHPRSSPPSRRWIQTPCYRSATPGASSSPSLTPRCVGAAGACNTCVHVDRTLPSSSMLLVL